MKKKDEIVEIDILKLAKAVLRNVWAVILAAIIGGAAVFGYTYFTVDPTYESKALMYVNNTGINIGSNYTISSSGLAAAQELVKTYIVILEARTTVNEIIKEAGVDKTYSQVKGMIEAAPVNETEIFEVVVTSTDPEEAEIIANAITKVLPNRIADVVDGSSVRIVDYAVLPSGRSGPSYSTNTMIGILAGIAISVFIIVIREMYDVFIREEEYLTDTYGIPVLAAIPHADSRSGGYYKYGKYGSGKYSKYSYKSTYYYSSEEKGGKDK